MKRIAIFLMSMLVAAVGFGQIIVPKKPGQQAPERFEWHFGFTLMASYTGELVQYGWIRINLEDKTSEIVWLTKDRFMRQMMGKELSRANKNLENLFEKNGVDPQAIDNLWKLRYQAYPYDVKGALGQGWAGKELMPSEAQWSYLKKNYDYSSLMQFVHGDAMWKLLKEISDPDFANYYGSLK